MTKEDAIKWIESFESYPYFPIESAESCRMAIVALKKQIPKKTITTENNLIRNGCPDCNSVNEDGNNYCRFCGQRLDWEGWRI